MNKFKLISAMLIFGTIGIFVAKIDLPSSVIAMFRASIGAVFIGLIMLIRRRKLDFKSIKKNIIILLISGIAIGFNWILLFEAYRYTSVAVATLCYYMAPVFIILLSPLILREKLTFQRIICSAFAILGAVMISGATTGGADLKGVIFGLAAAMIYCAIVMMNKFIKDLPDEDTTLLQLGISAVVMFIYVMITEDIKTLEFTKSTVVFVIILGVVHTGLAYLLYFGSLKKVSAQSAAVFSYIDPVTAIILSSIILSQPITLIQIVGTVLILGSTLLNEILSWRKTT